MFTQTGLRGLLRPQSTTSQSGLLAGIFRATTAAAPSPASTSSPTTPAATPAPRPFSTTAAAPARVTPKAQAKKPAGQKVGKPMDSAAARAQRKKRKSQMEAKLDPKVSGLMKFIYAGSQVQAPLRMARNRWLRHWTVHRAWQLSRRREGEAAEREMMRMQQSMGRACEALRTMGGPGTRPEGWLYRKAMEKKGIWGRDAVPIEYARPMVETPGSKPWNHEWKRS
ncbi:hypothetical protein VPNG_04147 [Cytospora leucostoma]|uniref:Uncharacterized protein n=1 Tax=Cytospora leucostoma TaxID=1230097 RepID=A0A423XDF3_9PEZI|nr:hypothetical protein VPNG_04147 [Cytospora leucostoma]